MSTRYLAPIIAAVLGAAAWRNWQAWRRQTAGPKREATRSPSLTGWPGTPKVSVLVAAWNEAALVAGHIQSFKELSYPSLQLVLCAGGDDGTYEIAQQLADDRIVLLKQLQGEGKQRALGRCLGASDGEIIMLSDADCRLADEPFHILIGSIVRGETDVATGFRTPLRELRRHDFVRFQWFSEQASVPLDVSGLWGGNCAFRRTIGEQSKALNLPAPTGTDYVQGRTLINAGYPIRWIPESRVETRYPTSAGSYVQTTRRWTKNILIYGPRFGDWRSVFQIVTAIALASGMLLPPLLAPRIGQVAVALPSTFLAVATMNRVRRIAVGARNVGARPTWRLFAAAPMFALLDQVAMLAAVIDLFSRHGRARW